MRYRCVNQYQARAPLHFAAMNGHVNVVEILLTAGADIEAKDFQREAPLHYAAADGHAACLQKLIDAGADINTDADTAFHPLQESLVYGNEECAKILKAAGATIKEEELHSMTTEEGIEKKQKSLAKFAEKSKQEKVVKGLKSVEKGLPWEVQNLDSSSAELFADLVAKDSYELYDTRYMLVGEKDVGKTTLADFLVGKPPNFERQPTNGISLYNALAFLNRKTKEWLSGDQGFTLDQLLASKLLKVNPLAHNIRKEKVILPSEEKRVESIEQMSTTVTQNTDLMLGDQGENGNHSENSAPNSNSIGRSTCYQLKGSGFHEDNLADDSSKEKNISVSTTKGQVITTNIDVSKPDDEEITKHNIEDTALKSYSADNATSYQNISGDFQEVKEAKNNTILVTITKEDLLAKSWAAGELKIHHNNLVPVLIWDLGGQDTFNATHPTFLTFRAIYVVVFNGSISLDEPVKEFDRLPGMPRNRTSRDYLKFWVKSILTYNKGHDNRFPKILFVATHRDKVTMVNVEKVRTSLYDDVDSMFPDSISRHLVTHHRLFVSAVERSDPEMIKLKKILAEMSFMQPTWGEKVPTCFLPLEMQLSSLVANGLKIMKYDELCKLNEAMPIRPLTNQELDLFLSVQHATGKLLYFPLQKLNEKIILAPTHLIDAFRSIVTDRQFCTTDGRLQSWNQMSIDGVLKKSTLDQIWQQPEFSHFWCDREYLISLMTHLDILTEPRRYNKNGSLLASDFFLVPSMVRKRNKTSYFEASDFAKRAICLSFACSGEILPPALCYRFITYCLSVWPIKKYGNIIEEDMLFEDEAVLVIDNSLDLAIRCGEDRILVRLVHVESNSLIMEDVATAIRECVETTLTNITRMYQQFFSNRGDTKGTNVQSIFEIKPCCASAYSPCTLNDMTHLETAKTWQCPDHEIVHSQRSLLAWFIPKGKIECSRNTCANENFLSQCPSDLHLGRLSHRLTEMEMRELFIRLGNNLVEWKNIRSNYKDIVNVNFVCLITWRDGSDNCTFDDLKICLENIQSNPHTLCIILKESFIDFADPELDRVPSDKEIDELASLIGSKSMRFLVELGLTFRNWEEIEFACRRETELVKINRCIINKWKENCELQTGVKPSLRSIYKAFVNIGKNQRIVEKQLQNRSFKR